MLFPTMIFGLFFLFVYATAWSLERENGRRKVFLVLASWVFYGWWDWRFVGLLIHSAIFNWWVSASVARTNVKSTRHCLIALCFAVNLSVRVCFIYYGFFVDQRVEALKLMHWERDLPLRN